MSGTNKFLWVLAGILFLGWVQNSWAAPVVVEEGFKMPEGPILSPEYPAPRQNCLFCHDGLAPARDPKSEMMVQIFERGKKVGDPNGCVVCHGGNPAELQDVKKAHSGSPEGNALTHYTPVPGAMQVNEKTCGLCHPDHVYAGHRSIMNSDAGKIKAILWSWGIGTENKDHVYGNHAIDDPDGPTPRFGTEKYKAYMLELAEKFPGQYPAKLEKIPQADTATLAAGPEQAAYSYLRACNACHLSNKGMTDRGHFRGMGCSSCHKLYGVEGFYEGQDKSIKKDEPGHQMIHTFQGTEKTKVRVNGQEFSGIQLSTCAACHAAGRRIGHAYQGLMAYGHSDNRGPFTEKGEPQMTNGGYVFKYIRDDVHHRISENGTVVGGMLCQDCHTSTSMHGNGNIGSTSLATVEIECADCHGTPQAYPWELPLGFEDEFGLDRQGARGLAEKPMQVTQDFATVYPARDGFLLSARGNPLGNVVKDGDKVILHSAGGGEYEVPVLRQKNLARNWKDPLRAEPAMVRAAKHMDSLECYACHSTWAAQYYGYKYTVDYSQKSIDWIDSCEKVFADGSTADFRKEFVMQPGLSTIGDYSHVRWENPPLGINGEGRVTPLTGVIQTIGTVMNIAGKTVAANLVAKTPQGYNAMELAPLNPHTTSRQARACQDCHGSLVAAGYGVDGGVYDAEPGTARFADVMTADGKPISQHARPQIVPLAGLHGDFAQALLPDGTQVQTVDSHWPLSSPLKAAQRAMLDREMTCAACHRDIPDGSVAMGALNKVALATGLSFADGQSHQDLVRQNNLAIAWIKVAGIALGILAAILLPLAFIYRKKLARVTRDVLQKGVNKLS